MNTNKIAVGYFAVLVGTLLVFTVLYDVGMSTFEGESRSFIMSFEVVMQTFTTVGYGGDSPWESSAMNGLVITMQVATLVLVFAALPAVVIPLIEDSLSASPATSREGLTDHVVVCNATTNTKPLVDELVERDVPYVVLESDREAAITLQERGREVVHGSPESIDDLRGINAAGARAVVSDDDDEVDMSIITAVKEVASDVPVYSLAEEEDYVEYHELAGAEEAFVPRTLLGRGIANKVQNTVQTDIDRQVTAGEDFRIAEIPVSKGSELDGRRLTEGGFVESSTADGDDGRNTTPWGVIGVWAHGQFYLPPFDGIPLDEHAVLLTVGRSVTLRSIARRAGSVVNTYGRGRVLVAGAGIAGRIVSDGLVADKINHSVIDVEDGPRVDIVGDVTEEEVLDRAGIDDARTVVLALDDDTVTLVASFVIGKVAPDVEIVARANDAESVPKLYRAGVDYVLTLSTVAGHLLLDAILDSDRSIRADTEIRLVDREPGSLAGQTIGEADLRARTGCTVVAIERVDGRVSTDLRSWTDIEPTDHLVVAGNESSLDRLDDLL